MAQLQTQTNQGAAEFNLPKMNIYTFAQENGGKTVANAFVHTGLFKYNGIRVVEGSNGKFISMPSQKSNQTGEDGRPVYYDRFYPASKEARQALTDAIVAKVEGKESEKVDLDMYSKDEIQIEINLNNDENGNATVKNGVLATVKVTTPLMVHPWIQVRENPKEADDYFLSFPAYKTNKQDENGKDIYNRYFEPFNGAARDFLNKIIFEALQKEIEG